MNKIGMLVAVEVNAVLTKYGDPVRCEKHGSFDVRIYEKNGKEIIVISSGAGEIAAAAASQLLISLYHADMIVNFGLVGGLTEETIRNKNCVVTKVVHYDFDTSGIDPVKPCQYEVFPDEYIPVDQELVRKAMQAAPELRPVICASGDKFITDPAQKEKLQADYGAEICEMEAAAIALTAWRNGVPALFIKIVSDGLFDDPQVYYKVKKEASERCFEIVDLLLGDTL